MADSNTPLQMRYSYQLVVIIVMMQKELEVRPGPEKKSFLLRGVSGVIREALVASKERRYWRRKT